MKKPILFIILLISQYVASQNWSLVGPANFNSEFASSTMDMTVDSNGVIYVAYTDFNDAEAANVYKYSGGVWTSVGGADVTQCCIQGLKIEIGENDTPYILYKRLSEVRVKKFNGTSWEGVVSPGALITYDFEADNNGVLHISQRFDNALSVQRFNGTTWELVGNADFSTGDIAHSRLTFDNNNVPYVLYSDFPSGYRGSVKRLNGANWESVGIDGFTPGIIASTNFDISISSSGIPYVAFGDSENDLKASVMRFVSGAWEYVGGEAFTPSSGTKVEIEMVGAVPYISYIDGSLGAKAICKMFNGTSWETFGQEGFSPGAVSANILDLVSGALYSLNRDNANSFGCTVHEIISPTLGINTINKEDLKISVQNNQYLLIEGINANNADIKIYDIYGKLIFNKVTDIDNSYRVQLPNALSTNVYVLKIKTSKVTYIKKFTN